jgi:hypothetical protein
MAHRNSTFFKLLIISLLVTGCSLVNLRNLENENKWKNKTLHPPLTVHYDFDPILIRAYDHNSYFLEDHVEDSTAIYKLDSLLQVKLTHRNFRLSKAPEFNLLKVDSLIFEEYTEQVPVYSEEGDYLTDATYYWVNLYIHGYLNTGGSTSELDAQYNFESEPMPGIFISSLTMHHNSGVNIKKVLAILMNRFSYEAYKVAKEVSHNSKHTPPLQDP